MSYSPTIADAKELMKFSANVYGTGGPIPPGWSAIASRIDQASGLSAIVYQSTSDPTKFVLAIAGTQRSNSGGIDTDALVLGNNFPADFDRTLREVLPEIALQLPRDSQIA